MPLGPQSFPNGWEVRAVAEIRTAGRTLYGTAAPFNAPADIGGRFRETILPGAFTAALAKQPDILALADHRSDALLGRTKSGTLRLAETRDGLTYALDLPPTALGDELHALALRNDLGGVSIGFVCDRDTWADNRRNRQLHAVTVHEISIIRGHAAYGDGTTIAVRAALAGQDAARLRRLRLAVL